MDPVHHKDERDGFDVLGSGVGGVGRGGLADVLRASENSVTVFPGFGIKHRHAFIGNVDSGHPGRQGWEVSTEALLADPQRGSSVTLQAFQTSLVMDFVVALHASDFQSNQHLGQQLEPFSFRGVQTALLGSLASVAEFSQHRVEPAPGEKE